MKSLAITVKQLREEKGFTQAELAKKAGIGNGTLGDIERGANKSTIKTISKIATALLLNQKEKDLLFSSFLGREINQDTDSKILSLNKRERLQFDDFMKDAILYFQDEKVSEEDKQKLINSLQEAFFEIKLANKKK